MKILTGFVVLVGCCLSSVALAEDAAKAGAASSDSNTMLALLLLIVLLAVVFGIWNCHEWLGAKANEAKERARKMKLENDKLEIEVHALRNNKTPV